MSLTESQLSEIKSLLQKAAPLSDKEKSHQGLSCAAIAKRFGVSRQAVQRIRRNEGQTVLVASCAVCGDEYLKRKGNQITCGTQFCLETIAYANQVKHRDEHIARRQEILSAEREMNRAWNRVFAGL